MVKHMLKRQIVEDILSPTFLINFILIIGVVVAFCLIFLDDYQGQVNAYAFKNAKNEITLRHFSEAPQGAYLDVNMQLVMKPRAERFVSLSYEDKSPQGLYFQMYPYQLRVLSKKEDITAGGFFFITKREYVTPPELFSPDLTFIVQFLLSFLAVILAFNAVTGEKETGTLKLIYANPAKRSHFIAMKYFSALSTLGLPLLLSLIVSALILGISSAVPLSSGFLYSLVMFAILSFLYLSVFVLIGLLCSTTTRNSRHSLVLSLLFWILLVVILPKSPGLLLDLKRFDVPTGQQIEEMTDKFMHDTQKKYHQEFMALRSDKEAFERLAEKFEVEVLEGQQGIRDYYLNKKIAAVLTLRKVNMVSPATLYEYAASAVAGTGIFHFENFRLQARQFSEGFVSSAKQILGIKRTSSLYQLDTDAITNKRIDYNSFPRFDEKDIAPGQRITEAVPFIGLLVLYNLFLFAFVFHKFQTYDVR